MLNHCKSLIFNMLAGGVNSQCSAEGNDRKIVSVTPYYINTSKASKARPKGFGLGVFFVHPSLRAKRGNPEKDSFSGLLHCVRNDATRVWERSPVWNPPAPFAKGEAQSDAGAKPRRIWRKTFVRQVSPFAKGGRGDSKNSGRQIRNLEILKSIVII